MGLYEAETNTLTLRFVVKGLRYEGRTANLDQVEPGDRGRYAKQGILFLQLTLRLRGV